MRKIPREVSRCCNWDNPVETTRRLLNNATQSEFIQYLVGALGDATYHKKHKTIRFSQANIRWLKILQMILTQLKRKSWIYREGKTRKVWVLETSYKLNKNLMPKNQREKITYIRGYFDAEGGMPKNNKDFLYFQFCQKNKSELKQIKKWLIELGIKSGKIHNPSKKVDENYWRIFISRKSHKEFMKVINSWHPRKKRLMEFRMKI